MKTKRLIILENSLEKKNKKLDERFSQHFADVKSANGQPLNDKRNGQATLTRWERQNDAIRNLQASIEKTQNAIDREQNKIFQTQHGYEQFPQEIKTLIDEGILKQWRKHPHILFVEGVERARLVWHRNTKMLVHRYTRSIPEQEQFSVFAKVFNQLNQSINKKAA